MNNKYLLKYLYWTYINVLFCLLGIGLYQYFWVSHAYKSDNLWNCNKHSENDA